MRNPRIYAPVQLQEYQPVDLPESAANHVGRVLRMKPSDPLILFNGEGGCWQARINAVSKKQVQVVPLEFMPIDKESPLTISLGQTLSRGERMDYAIQKAVEAGVTEITPLFTERCEVKLNSERADKRLRHWQQIIISACEQCGRNIVPVIHSPVPVSEWVANRNTDLKFVLHHRTKQALTGYDSPKTVSLLIGPEGGLTADEISTAEGQGFNPLVLGPRVLRTETAPVAAISLMQYLWGDWS
ncbi:16S rRNA (uracil(1498)-N(3))-methyltransferase [Sansalvadorimonas sp. 2012CJ34-2]|uniref:Ribosomal RNA small subunit methyltransferase E n=1 Tax=Parendozoicomonas callyspongiae TaxID=2942213 RepID=A0ABT0PAM7_9GAMM|nr:16S rRNA (uracil(1498)-N(3))-methyltransferase [Sansalvadorimonas sp. 2012CJ34-2]MCL6268443.1 16S rRNA (uracil(1498)-N(3))-methyltransferase [Sansalvadorimonas sp. 2012CJ34-2]